MDSVVVNQDLTTNLFPLYLQSYRQFRIPITATLTTNLQAVNGNVQQGAGPVTFPGDIFHCRSIKVVAFGANGVHLSPEGTFDQILVSITEANSGFTFTNGNVDLLSFWDQGVSNNWAGWMFYQQEQLNVTFTLNQATAGSAITTLPCYVNLILIGERYGNGDFPQALAKIRERAYLQ